MSWSELGGLAGAGLIAASSAALTMIARIDDVDAFRAVASPATYACLALSVTCAVALWADRIFRSRGGKTPIHFRLALGVGVLAGIVVAVSAIKVLGKTDAKPEAIAPMSKVDLNGQTIKDVSYNSTELRGALLQNATFDHVDLAGADLSEADLRFARLEDVNVAGANLCGADLRGADLSKVEHLDQVADWAYAFYDDQTRLPKDMDFSLFRGAIPDTGRGLLYMCNVNDTRRLEPTPGKKP